MRENFCRTALYTLTIAGFVACGREGARVARAELPLAAVLDTSRGVTKASVVITGWSSAELAAISPRTDSAMQQLVQITVGASNATPVTGKYSVNDSAIVFQPLFPFDAGRTYSVRVNSAELPSVHTRVAESFALSLPAGDQTPRTAVARILPGADTLPENLLRFYIEFSRPMSRTGGLEFMKLLDENGREVVRAFLPLDADFWNDDRTRYTAFLDPGRVKRGILPNEQMGRAILSGHTYTLAIDSAWRDNDGLPLTASFRRTFHVSAPDENRIELKSWKIVAPTVGTRDALVVTFPKPLDFGLLRRAMGVESANGRAFVGSIDIQRTETEWRFTPAEAWQGGTYQLVVFSILEDAAGNRIDRPFEVDQFERVDKDGTPERFLVPFTTRVP